MKNSLNKRIAGLGIGILLTTGASPETEIPPEPAPHNDVVSRDFIDYKYLTAFAEIELNNAAYTPPREEPVTLEERVEAAASSLGELCAEDYPATSLNGDAQEIYMCADLSEPWVATDEHGKNLKLVYYTEDETYAWINSKGKAYCHDALEDLRIQAEEALEPITSEYNIPFSIDGATNDC